MPRRPSRFRRWLRRRSVGHGLVARGVSVLVLIIALGLTALATSLASRQQLAEQRAVFEHQATQVVTLIDAQMRTYIALARAGQGLFSGSDEVSRADWRAFGDALGIRDRYPGLSSYVYIALDEDAGGEVRCPIVYSERAGPGDPALGFDACASSVTRTTMMDARERGEVLVSPRLSLRDLDTDIVRPGVVVYAPVYRGQRATSESLQGWVGISVRIGEVMDALLPPEDMALTIVTGADDSAPLFERGTVVGAAGWNQTASLDLPGRSWTLRFARQYAQADVARAVGLAGVVISLLLWLLLWRAGAVQGRAEGLAAQMTEAFRESEAQRQRAEAFSLVMVTRIGLDGRWQQVPLTLGRLLGRHPSRLVGTHYREVVAPEDFDLHWTECERLLRGEIRSFDMEERFIHADGHTLWLYVNWSIVTDEDGEPVQFLAYLRDISDAKRTDEALKRSEEKYRTIIESLEDAYFESDLEGNLTFFNDALVRTLGREPDALHGLNNREYMHPDDHKAVFQAFNRVYATGDARRGLQWRVVTQDGSERFVEASISLIRDATGAPTGFRGIARDITERRLADERIHHLAHYDALTGLPNRTLFEDRVKQALRRRRRHGERAALLFLDLDRFKTVNDSLGHHTGDLLLQAVARRITECVRIGDTVCRPGGDEFLVLLADLGGGPDAATVAEKILTSVAKPYTIEGWEFSITPSIGIAVIPDDGEDIDTLVRNADAAMYHAKESGRNNFQFFTEAMTENAAERLALEHGLRRALERDELELYYQPLVDVRDGRIVGAEALLRWNRPDHGVVTAGEFIGIVEQSGLILGMGEWVMARACRQAQRWYAHLGRPLPVSVNLSALQFRQHGLPETIARALQDAELDPACLELELTESVVMQDAALTIDTVHRLRELGVHFAIDDFGTGYSSLSYLKRFPIDRVKIDRSFVRDLEQNPDDTALINAIVSMARSLRMEVIAEGVETVEQMAYLYKQDCFVMQGYLFSRPVPADQFEELLVKGVIHP